MVAQGLEELKTGGVMVSGGRGEDMVFTLFGRFLSYNWTEESFDSRVIVYLSLIVKYVRENLKIS